MAWFRKNRSAAVSVDARLNAVQKQLASTQHALRAVKARYDAAQTTEDNRRHWAAADSLSSVSANSPQVRRILRNRSRYEVANNCYARGIINTIAAYTVGIGPTLQLSWRGEELSPEQEIAYRRAAQKVEQLWATWAYARKLASKLTTASIALDQDGEVFAITRTARRTSMMTPVTLDITLMEADWFDDPTADFGGTYSGVKVDSAGEPKSYAKLRQHPGDDGTWGDGTADWISADRVLHLFRRERPGQLRGIPRTTPALPLFAQLRRFTLATITAAETAADFAAILYGDAPADTEDPMIVDAWDRVEIERGGLLTAPGGSRLAQLKAEHPNATYDEFVRSVLREIARCLGCPAVIALGDASNYNYASGRLDLQSFNRQLAADRSQIFEIEFLDRLYEQWIDEALLIDGFLPREYAATAGDWEWGWRWSEAEHVDRAKEATGQRTELLNNTTTLAREYAKRGLDWENELRQRAREVRTMRDLGLQQLMPDGSGQGGNQNGGGNQNEEADDDQDDEQNDGQESTAEQAAKATSRAGVAIG